MRSSRWRRPRCKGLSPLGRRWSWDHVVSRSNQTPRLGTASGRRSACTCANFLTAQSACKTADRGRGARREYSPPGVRPAFMTAVAAIPWPDGKSSKHFEFARVRQGSPALPSTVGANGARGLESYSKLEASAGFEPTVEVSQIAFCGLPEFARVHCVLSPATTLHCLMAGPSLPPILISTDRTKGGRMSFTEKPTLNLRVKMELGFEISRIVAHSATR